MPEIKPNLTECALYFCKKAYENNYFSTNHRILEPTKTQQLFPRDTAPDATTPLFPPNGKETLSRNSTYHVELYTLRYLINTLIRALDTTLSSDSQADNGSGFKTAAILYTSTDLGQTMKSMATSMTDIVRVNAKATQVAGQAFRTQTYIHVRWEWIILPASMAVLSIILLVATRISNHRQHVVLWKSSVLALLMCQVQRLPEHDDLGFLHDVDHLQRLSKKINVTLEQDEEGPLALVEH